MQNADTWNTAPLENADTWHTAPLPEKMEMGKQVRLIATHVLLQQFF